MKLPPYAVIEKAVGETPLAAMESWRLMQNPEYIDVPLTYAGRLDPMASGKLLVLIGEECKQKDRYLALDKTYDFSVLLGIGSDTHDVLGRLHVSPRQGLGYKQGDNLERQLRTIAINLTGDIELPYPHFSSKTVQGKPLHTWTLEGRLDEIQIPTKASTIYSLELSSIETRSRTEICDQARAKIDTIPKVTDASKTLGNDFRRADVRKDWEEIKNNCWTSDVGQCWPPDEYVIAHFTCSASSGTYMRTLAKLIGEKLDPARPSLAWSIHRSAIHGVG